MNSRKLLIPANLDIDTIIKRNRTLYMRNSLGRENLLFICSSLVKARAKQRKKMMEDETTFVNLCSRHFQKIIRNYNKHIGFLIYSGVICSDNRYKKGEKCTGYCFTDEYLDSPPIEVEIESYRLRQSIRRAAQKLNIEDKKTTWGYSYLTKWLDCNKLDIDLKGAHLWIDNYIAAKIKAIQQNPDLKNKERKILETTATSRDFKLLTKMIKQGELTYKFSGVGHRFYSPITYLKKELRNFLSFEGKNLVSIDLKNSQPYLSLVLFKPNFWTKKGRKGLRLSILRGISNDIKLSNQYKALITLVNSPEILASQEGGFEKYKSSVIGGRFYEDIQAIFEHLYPDRFDSRDKVKKEVMRILYSDPKKDHLQFYKPSLRFYKQFPLVYEMFKWIKEKDYTYLPLVLQRIESYLIIDVICKKVGHLEPKIPLFTIHDSIVTTQGYEGFIEAVMIEELEKWVGYKPKLDIQYLIPNEN